MRTINVVYSKIDYGVKPGSVGLVFPDNNINEIQKIYETFYRTSYDKILPYEELEKKSIIEFSEFLENTYDMTPRFFEILPCDIYAPKEYLSAMDLPSQYGRKRSTLDDISEQFTNYLWNNNIPVAQHLAVKLSDELETEFNRIEIYQREQEN
jgi:hypothetical protein